nr:MAG: alpha/beta hydrolase [Chloroflexota bacterium]
MIATPPAAPSADLFCPTSRLRYFEAGAGEQAVVLLHGWGDSKEIWRATSAALAPHTRVLAPDLPGHGGAPPAGGARMAGPAARAAGLGAAGGGRGGALVGHSMGGNVALELALSRPDLVRRLVLVAPAALGGDMPAYTRIYLHPAFGWAALRGALALYGRLAELARRIPRGEELPIGGLLRRSTHTYAHDPGELRLLLRGLFDNPLGPRLPEVRAPTLVVSGELDLVVPAALSRRVAAAIPGARYVGLPRAAHHPMDERPREFQRALLDFLGGGAP